jgi:hypothetical protein
MPAVELWFIGFPFSPPIRRISHMSVNWNAGEVVGCRAKAQSGVFAVSSRKFGKKSFFL